MTELVVQIRFAQELEEWHPSYPGDPLVRPASYSYDIRYNERALLEDWLDQSTPGYHTKWSSMRHPTGIRTFGNTFNNVGFPQFPDGWNEGTIHFKSKSHAALFKLAFQ